MEVSELESKSRLLNFLEGDLANDLRRLKFDDAEFDWIGLAKNAYNLSLDYLLRDFHAVLREWELLNAGFAMHIKSVKEVKNAFGT